MSHSEDIETCLPKASLATGLLLRNSAAAIAIAPAMVDRLSVPVAPAAGLASRKRGTP